MSKTIKSTKFKSPKAKSNHRQVKAKGQGKSQRSPKPAPDLTKTQPKPTATPASQAEQGDSPFRAGTLYSTLFNEGREYIAKADLIKKVASLTGKSEKVCGYAFAVLKSKSHRSNGGRSTLLVDDASGLVKFVAVKKASA